MKQKIAVAKGDGIGPEIMDSVLTVFRSAQVPLDYELVEMGKSVFEKGFSNGMTPEAAKTVEDLGILFKGPMETPKGKGVKSINVTARKVWNTYANKRVFRSLNGVETVFSKAGIPIDMIVVRENIEDTYGGIEHMLTPDVALCRRFITRPGSLQVHRYAFEMARAEGRKKVTCGHKANIMKITDGLFLETFYEVAKEYPEIIANDIIVDDLSMKLVSKPHEFDVVVLPNLQGDIVSDLCAGLVGGLGFAPSANIGEHISIFEAVHGTAPDIAGKGLANPTALLISGIMMLRHLELHTWADRISAALFSALEDGYHTADFGSDPKKKCSTEEFTAVICSRLEGGIIPEKTEWQKPTGRTQNKILKTKFPKESKCVGVDFFVESVMQPADVAAYFQKHFGSELNLVTMSNRGTQVYPKGSVFTDCIDQYRVRIQKTDQSEMSSDEILHLASKISSGMKICSLEWLMNYDGVNAFSLAQGQ
ncbi:MAG: NADP-dependent isocitrate dehydrogenase [Flavobacteriales bacterium]|nr:NADP-dependent isocitrate dehydrogenase [Flavobacteriales bacterium]